MESQSPVKRIGIIGGSFDPIHIGHLIIAQDAAEQLGLSEVVFIPTEIPPHKQQLQRADAGHRLKMLECAVKTNVQFSVSDIEVRRGGISYTVDTLEALCEYYPDATLLLIVGSDTLVELHTWHEVERILELCEVITFLRPGEDSLEEIAKKIQLPEEQKKPLLRNMVDAHRIGISSSEIRKRLMEGLDIHYLVPLEVERYIYEHGLYQGREE